MAWFDQTHSTASGRNTDFHGSGDSYILNLNWTQKENGA